MKIFISPHDDDHALFGAFTCLREKPLVIVVTDSFIQPARGEVGCSAEERAKETEESCKVLGIQVARLEIPDESATYGEILKRLEQFKDFDNIETVYAPMVQNGNPHHDMVSVAASVLFGDKVMYYPTYTKTELYTEGDIEIIPTPEEQELKNKSLDCYISQIRINGVHFDALRGKSEWLSPKMK